ncbi:recombination-associated protein RdgC [Gynuella sunshinyii]|uniref:Recombination-associated protein RdgC n=1 Tax=Gynuella sunshinyii YC6258 TaxID=1445510 RepID=A0A0C5VFS3_9GAMM|nr:recombination-associated protein RdgC [Gynuella sunshinyii]AJQ93041.1 DNA recombination-dependent growth factor C [Gynuella sunshinyii YC6258]
MLWFKNAQVYTLSDSFEFDETTAEEQLQQHLFGPCQKQQTVSLGWVPAIPDTDALIHRSGNNYLLCVKRQERLLPGAVVNEVLAEKVEAIQLNEDRRVGSKERQTLKDEVIFELLPQAFLRSTLNYVFLNPVKKLLIVNVASDKRSDEVTAFMRDSLGSLPVKMLSSDCQPAPVLTSWLENPETAPEQVLLLPDLELSYSHNPDIKVRLKNLELESDELQMHLSEGALVQQIALSWQERIDCVINHKAQIKRLRFADLLTEQALNDAGDDKASQFDASFTIMAEMLVQLVEDIRHWFQTRQPS